MPPPSETVLDPEAKAVLSEMVLSMISSVWASMPPPLVGPVPDAALSRTVQRSTRSEPSLQMPPPEPFAVLVRTTLSATVRIPLLRTAPPRRHRCRSGASSRTAAR